MIVPDEPMGFTPDSAPHDRKSHNTAWTNMKYFYNKREYKQAIGTLLWMLSYYCPFDQETKDFLKALHFQIQLKQ